MKLIKLTIHNLASIEDAVIDFENGPLSEDSLFLISGPTGSGKSTILDAICLALYATTPRLKESNGDSFLDNSVTYTTSRPTSADKDFPKNKILANDPRMLMRRGATDARVELIFTDKDDRVLKSEWSCEHGHRNLNQSIKLSTVCVVDEKSGEVLASKITDFRKSIQEAIGMTFDQFCKTTMLAQGEFTKFLKSKDEEKSSILEKLTGTDIYSQISLEIFQIKKEKETVCSNIEAEMKGVQQLTEEEILQNKESQEALKVQIEKLTETDCKIASAVTWLKQFLQLKEQVAQVDSLFRQSEQLIRTEDFKRDCQMVTDWERTVEQREWLKNRMDSQITLEAKEKEKVDLENLYHNLEGGFLNLQNSIQKGIAYKKELEEFLAKEKSKEPCYTNILLVESKFKDRKNAIKGIEESVKLSEEFKRNEEALKSNSKAMLAELEKVTLEAQQKKEAWEAESKKLEEFDYAHLLESQHSLNEQITKVNEYRSLTKTFEERQALSLQKEAVWKQAVELVKGYQTQSTNYDQKVKTLEDDYKVQLEIYDKQRMACDNMMGEFRHRLNEGEVCPLCGQKIEHLPTDEYFESILEPIEKRLKEMKQQLDEEKNRLNTVCAQLETSRCNEVNLKRDWETAKSNERSAEKEEEEHMLHPAFKNSEDVKDDLDKALVAIEHEKKSIDVLLHKYGAQLAVVQSQQQIYQKATADETLKREKVQKVANQLQLLANNIKQEESRQTDLKEQIQTLEQYLAVYVDIKLLDQKGDAYLVDLNNKAIQYQRSQMMLQEVGNKLQRLDEERTSVLAIKEKIDEIHPDWKGKIQVEPLEIDKLSSSWNELHTWLISYEEVRNLAYKQWQEADKLLVAYLATEESVTEERLRELYQIPNQTILEVKLQLQHYRDNYLQTKAQKETIEQNLADHEKNKPAFVDERRLDELDKEDKINKTALNEANQQLGSLVNKLETDKKNRQRFATIIERLEVARKELVKWNGLNSIFGSSDGKKFRTIAQSFILGQLLANANTYLRQFTHRYEMTCQPESLTILLIDKEDGGVLRPVSTLSGGESFLLSLSLALSLSHLSQSTRSMDILFIDEGFGTLDSTNLSVVIDALEKLHNLGGKKVGIISHVDSLKERLTTQIQITRKNSTISEVKVVSII